MRPRAANCCSARLAASGHSTAGLIACAFSAAIHLVNWNLAANGERAELYRNVTLTVLQPQRWGQITSATYLQPGQKPLTIEAERHDDCVRLTLPRIETWGVVGIK